MDPDTKAITELHDPPVPVRARLTAAWTSLMLLYVYVDILSLYMPGVIDDILAGVVWEFDVSQAWATGALTLMAIPILMVVLSMTLPARANRTTNLVVASAYVLISAGNAAGESWTYYYAVAVGLEVIVLALILRFAWTWPRTPSRRGQTPPHHIDHRSSWDGRNGRCALRPLGVRPAARRPAGRHGNTRRTRRRTGERTPHPVVGDVVVGERRRT